MKKYNTPNIEVVTLHSSDCIATSQSQGFSFVASGVGANWDWSDSVSNESGML